MTTLDREALVAHIRACANGTDLLQDGAFQMSARRTIRKALNDAADALSSIPEQGVEVKALEWSDKGSPTATQQVAYTGIPEHYTAFTDGTGKDSAQAHFDNAIRASLVPSHPAAVGEDTTPNDLTDTIAWLRSDAERATERTGCKITATHQWLAAEELSRLPEMKEALDIATMAFMDIANFNPSESSRPAFEAIAIHARSTTLEALPKLRSLKRSTP